MECSSWKMIEQAKEELQILETLHPNHFDYLKSELKYFILLLQSQHKNDLIYHPSSSNATTQASTNNRKRKKVGLRCRNEELKHKFQRVFGEFKGRDRIDLVLEKAQSCLRKIQEWVPDGRHSLLMMDPNATRLKYMSRSNYGNCTNSYP